MERRRLPGRLVCGGLVLAGVVLLTAVAWICLRAHPAAAEPAPPLRQPTYDPYPMPAELAGVNLLAQSAEEAARKSAGCISCHKDTADPHFKETVHLGCCDCHGGDPSATVKEAAHVRPRFPDAWPTSGNPVRSFTLLNHEKPEFVRFVNPADLRVAHISCGTTGCHPREVLQNRMSMMTHGCMLWGAALYNNGSVPFKRPRYGESYGMTGVPQRLQTVPPPTEDEMVRHGVVPFLDPLPRFEMTQPGNILRIFERGGRFRFEAGVFEDAGVIRLLAEPDEPGRPRTRLSTRGLGTENRTDPTFLGLQKTRLLDPTLNFLGTNDHPGDYRSSGCTSCHIPYANDRSRVNSGPYAIYGHNGLSFSPDPTIPKNEPGHPIEHRFAPGNSIPTSQCIVCHVHPGTNVLNSYTGFMWWDEETDGELIYPEKQKEPTAEQFVQSMLSNPNESAARNNLSDPQFLERLADLNPYARHTQFADYHGHGWAFQAVFRQDRKGNLLDYKGNIVPNPDTPDLLEAMRFQKLPPKERIHREGVPVHYMDVHLELGMHCNDCHFVQDAHGNTRLQMEVRAGVEITCVDCHGTISKRATLRTTGPAAYTSGPEGSRNLEALRTPFGRRRFEREGNRIYQNSMVEKDLRWEVKQVADTIDPASPHYNKKAHLAKTMRFDPQGRMVWGNLPAEGEGACAHANKNMTCIACHSAWNPSCYGCHLPQRANLKMPTLHFEGDATRNYISYNFQTLRSDVYMLARDGDATGNRICPARSSCAVEVSSFNKDREAIYFQQQTISGGGLSGIAFSTNVPHTVRGRDGTKQCTDCHVSKDNDNNAIMAQLLMHGTNYLNLMGRNCWVAAGEEGLEAVVVTEREEPQAVIGSYLHRLAFPDYYRKHVEHHRQLEHAHHHPAKDVGDHLLHPFCKGEVLMVQARGEYLYAACGEGGLRVFDIAFIDDKGFAERIVTAPVSPLGQQFYVPTKYCTSVAAATTMAPDPTRTQYTVNREATVHAIYGYVFATDKYEGLILVGAATTIDGNPLNNFLRRDLTYNPDGLLNGARSVGIVGTYAYVCCDAGVVVLDMNDPLHPQVTAVLGPDLVHGPKGVAAQFRYGFVYDEEGIKVLDITDPAHPRPLVKMDLPGVESVYVARTCAYCACGKRGLVIVDVTNPEQPKIDQVFTAGGRINDLRDVKLGITYSSEFAYLADGKNGLRVVQLTSPETPGNAGFAPRPTPELIATYRLKHGACALNVSKGLDRDRAVDESGNQIGVFGRVGARPLTLEEQRKLYLRGCEVWKVSDDPDDPRYHYIGPPPQAVPGKR
jgi:hypothetical protein